jgi:hypothetical protein
LQGKAVGRTSKAELQELEVVRVINSRRECLCMAPIAFELVCGWQWYSGLDDTKTMRGAPMDMHSGDLFFYKVRL